MLLKPHVIKRKYEKIREDIAGIQVAEKLRREREKARQKRKQVIQQFNADYKIKRFDRYYSVVSLTARPKSTTNIERIMIIIDSMYVQTLNNIGKTALTTISKILQNTALVGENRLNEM